MENRDVKEMLAKVFFEIEEAETIQDVEKIMDWIKREINKKFILDDSKYPKIDFTISDEDIATIRWSDDLDFAENISSQIKTPLEKLFYAVAWKQGDLVKYKHIIKGIKEASIEETTQNQALTFYQFGKYLNDRKNQPIIDQHVIRAFMLHKYEEVDAKMIFNIRKLNELNSNHKMDILNYVNWIRKLSKEFPEEFQEEFLFKVDRILMAIGKAIKVNTNEKHLYL